MVGVEVVPVATPPQAAVRLDEASGREQQELAARLATENSGLRELLHISQRALGPRPRRPALHKEVQTEGAEEEGVPTVTLPRPGGARGAARVVEVQAGGEVQGATNTPAGGEEAGDNLPHLSESVHLNSSPLLSSPPALLTYPPHLSSPPAPRPAVGGPELGRL